MERNHALSVAVGVGAVGTALAYLGYSYYSKEKNTVSLTENHEQQTAWWNSIFENSNTIVEEANIDDNENTDNNDNTSENIVDKTSAWGQFWKSEYTQKNEKKEKKED